MAKANKPKIKTLRTDEERRAFVSPFRMELIGLFTAGEPLSIAQMAERMGRKATAIHYHVGVLEKAGLSRDDIDLYEINEAFSAQYLGCEKELELDRDRVNVNGGAISLGHPIGATGARIVVTLLHELARRGGTHGLATLCISGGQGLATAFHREGL